MKKKPIRVTINAIDIANDSYHANNHNHNYNDHRLKK